MNTSASAGFLYVANRPKFLEEATLSMQSLKRFNTAPVCVVCAPSLEEEAIANGFDTVIVNADLEIHTYMAKVVGMQDTPFDRTIFLDGDTFITDVITELFDILDLVDFAATAEDTLHTSEKMIKDYKCIFPEFHTGVIVYKNTTIMQQLMRDWLRLCEEKDVDIDMPGLREAVLLHFNSLRFSILPPHYNMHGFRTMLVLHNKVKVIHARLNYKWGYITPFFGPFEKLEAFSKKINKYHYKRLYIPKIGLIPYNWSPGNISLYIRKRLGFKHISKNK